MIQSIRRVKKLGGTVSLPGDKSISHRYALLAAISAGPSLLHHFGSSHDCHSTLRCLRALGVELAESGESVIISGRGLRGLLPPGQPLDAGNSGTTIRLLAGILAGHPFESSIGGDPSLSGRPMGRIIAPLKLMGASIESREKGLPPLKIRGGSLNRIRYSLPVASAQVKSCVLLAGLYGDGISGVEETVPTRDHTEIALRQFGGWVKNRGAWIEVGPDPPLKGQSLEIPGDLSSATFFVVAAMLLPGSKIVLPAVGLNPRRRALLDYLESAGADFHIENATESGGEVRGDLRMRSDTSIAGSKLPPIQGQSVAALIDEIPALAVLGSQFDGGLEISDAGELRIKESDRLAALAANLRAMGAEVDEKPDGLKIAGRQRLKGADIDTRGDHRIAMAFAIAGLVADGETRIRDAECANVSFPGFWETLTEAAEL